MDSKKGCRLLLAFSAVSAAVLQANWRIVTPGPSWPTVTAAGISMRLCGLNLFPNSCRTHKLGVNPFLLTVRLLVTTCIWMGCCQSLACHARFSALHCLTVCLPDLLT